MAKKVNNQGKGPAAPRQRLPQVVKQRPSVPFDSLIRQARLDPGLLAPGELAQLQRMVGNQAVGRLLAQTTPAQVAQRKGNLPGSNGSGVIQAVFDDIFKQTGEDIFVLKNGEVLTKAQGRGYMARITAGDASVLEELNLYGKDKIDEFYKEAIQNQTLEFGLGKDPKSDRCVIIAGLEGGVDWKPFNRKDLIPLAHSHPYTFARKLKQQVLISDLFNNKRLGTLVLPSVGDLWLAADDKVPVHTVYTPYKVIEDGGEYYVTDDESKVNNNSNNNNNNNNDNNNNSNDNSNNDKVDVKDFLSFEIRDAKTNGMNFVGTLKAIWRGKSILETTITATKFNKAIDPVKQGEDTKEEESSSELEVINANNLTVSNDEGDNFTNYENNKKFQETMKSLGEKSKEIDEEFDFGDDNEEEFEVVEEENTNENN